MAPTGKPFLAVLLALPAVGALGEPYTAQSPPRPRVAVDFDLAEQTYSAGVASLPDFEQRVEDLIRPELAGRIGFLDFVSPPQERVLHITLEGDTVSNERSAAIPTAFIIRLEGRPTAEPPQTIKWPFRTRERYAASSAEPRLAREIAVRIHELLATRGSELIRAQLSRIPIADSVLLVTKPGPPRVVMPFSYTALAAATGTEFRFETREPGGIPLDPRYRSHRVVGVAARTTPPPSTPGWEWGIRALDAAGRPHTEATTVPLGAIGGPDERIVPVHGVRVTFYEHRSPDPGPALF